MLESGTTAAAVVKGFYLESKQSRDLLCQPSCRPGALPVAKA